MKLSGSPAGYVENHKVLGAIISLLNSIFTLGKKDEVMSKFKVSKNQLVATVWGVGLLAVCAAVWVWYSQRLAGSQTLTSYAFFPLLGLMAFSLMWTHYIAGALRRYFGFDKKVLAGYLKITSWLVIFLILLHPGLLWFQLFQDGFGLPPASHMAAYTDSVARAALFVGSVTLTLFLMFEFRRWLSTRSWWRYIDYANIGAMLVIFIHALVLGGELDVLWYRWLWYAYGLTLIGAVVYAGMYDRKVKGGDAWKRKR